MTDAASSYLTLRTENVQLTLAVQTGERPAIIHFGQPLPKTEPQDLALLATRQWALGGPSVAIAASLSNELGAGMGGPPGFAAHRDGRAWASVVKTERVEQHSETDVTVHCADRVYGVGIAYRIILHPESDVLSIVSTVMNDSDTRLSIDWACAAAIPLDPRFTSLRGFTGRWSGEFQVQEVDLNHGSYLRENRAGRTSHDNFPGLIALPPSTTENEGPCVGFHLGWSGNNRVQVDRHTDGRRFVQMGELFFPGEMTLAPEESYETPALFAAWSDEGLSGMSRSFHRHLDKLILDPRTADKPRPVHYNTWEAVYFDHSEEKLMALADQAASVGAERFVLDDGWFGGRRGDNAGLGDWTVSDDVYPEGLHRLASHVRSHGMEFGIWFEPEMVNPTSDLYRKHPEWVLRADGVEQIPFRNQLTLDLTRPEVTEYLFEAISATVTTYDVAYIKWDMNRTIPHPGDGHGRAAIHRQTRAVYGLISRLREAHPALEIESCASGGGRADFGVLAHTDRLWTSDNNDALSRQVIQHGASMMFPLRVLGSHVGPKVCHITGRIFDMAFRVGTAIFGHMGMEVDLSTEDEADLATLRAGISLYKDHRALLHGGDVYRLDAPEAWITLGVVSTDKREALFSCALLDEHQTVLPGRQMLAGLDPAATYRLRLIWPQVSPAITVPSIIEAADLYGEGSLVSGEALMHVGLQLPLAKPNTYLIFHLESESAGTS
ncbi:MAG: alpha-galactosidase [Pseudomonadota bacterium]